MPGVCRLTDEDTENHTVTQGSPNVLINGLPCARVLIDKLSDGSTILTGDPTFIVNGFSVGRIGDLTTDELNMATGSPNVISNGGTVTVDRQTNDQLTHDEVYTLLDDFNQDQPPTVATRLVAAEQHSDDQASDPIYNQYVQFAETDAALPPPNPDPPIKQTAPPPGPPANPPVPIDCVDIQGTSVFPDTFPLSTNFTLGQVSTHTLVSDYPVIGQVGLTIQDVVCNLRALCINVLEPLLARYGSNLVINSGFRQGFGASQHYKGQAVDVSFLDASSAQASFDRAIEITNDFIYDQFIFEQNNTIWLHLSWNSAITPRRQILSKPRGTTYFPGLIRI